MSARNPRFKLTTEEVLQFALDGVRNTIGLNSGNPIWTAQDWQFHYKAEKELERRLKIVEQQAIRNP